MTCSGTNRKWTHSIERVIKNKRERERMKERERERE